MTIDLRARLRDAVGREGRPSSDYDLNPDVVLPKDRVLKSAGVLIAIVNRPGSPTVLLTKRASTLKHHPGQVAFPGGKVEPDDDGVVQAALREAQEEVGLDPSLAEVIGVLPTHETVTGFEASPVLSVVPPFEPKIDPDEVAEVFEVPLAHVSHVENYSIQYRRWRGQRRYYFTVPSGPYYIWGATARMLRALADRMTHDENQS